MRARLLVACAVLAVVVAASGSGGTAAEQPAPAYAVVGSTSGGAQTLVRVDPATLKPLRGGLAVPEGLALGGRSPDGRSAVFFEYRQPRLQVVDLERLENRRQIALAPAGWRARAVAWLTADRVAVVLQKMRGSYAQIVDRREVVLVDPFAGRVVARRDVPGRTALTASAAAGDKLVLLLGRGDARTRSVRIVAVDSAGRVGEANADLGAPMGLRLPSLAVEPGGGRAFVVAAGAPVIEVDLETMATSAHALSGGGALTANAPMASRQAVALADGTLVVAGHNGHREKGIEVSRPAGLALIDTNGWRLRMVDRAASGVSVSGETLLAYSFRIDRAIHRGRPIQKASGIGIRAYHVDGDRLWHRYGKQPLTATAFRQVALVHRHASPPIGCCGSFVIDLAEGRQVRSNTGAQQNIWLLPDVPGARPVRATAAVGGTEALELTGEAGGFEATVRADVSRVVATLVDGSERELAIESGRVSYEAATPDESAHSVQAFAGDRLLASISIPVACGGAAGPCATAEPLRGGAFAVLRSREKTSLAEVDPRTLAPLTGRSATIDGTTSAHALSADGSLAAVGSYENATVRVFDTAALDRAKLVAPLAPGNAGIRGLEWLAPDRLLAIVQKYKRSDRRAVSARELVVLDPAARGIVRRTPLPIGRAIVDVQASGGRLVAILRSSNHRGTGITLLVAGADGRVRSREIQLRRTEGVLPETRLTLERGGKRAFLLAWQPSGQRGPQPLREIDLDRLVVTERRVTIGEGRFHLPSAFMARAESFGEHGVLISGAFVPLFRDGKHVPAAGTFLLDTRTFVIRQLDPRANAFAVAGDRAYAYGSSAVRNPPRPRGIGVAAYASSGKRLYHAFGTRTFTRLVVAGGFGHLLRGDRSEGLAFELETGRSLGPQPVPDGEIEVLEAADAAPAANASARRPSAARAPAAADPFSRVANRGTRVEAKAEKRGEREMTPRDLFLLRRGEGRAVYRIGGIRDGSNACYASGPADEVGRLGQVGCGQSSFPSRQLPIYDMSSLQMKRGEKAPHLFRVAGVAADAVAEIGLLDADGEVVARVPVERNVYLLAAPPARATALAALDAQGRIVYRNDRRQRATPAPATPGLLAGFRVKLTLPDGWRGEIRRSTAGPGRALVFAGNRLPAKDPAMLSLVLDERDPRARPAFPRLQDPPQLSRRDLRMTGGGARGERRFTLNGRQFTLHAGFGAPQPTPAALAAANRVLATLQVGAIAVPPDEAKAGEPLQHGRANGVSVDVHRSGLVVFRFDPNGSAYRLLGRRQVSVACLTFDSVSPWESNEHWVSKPAAPTIQFVASEATRPRPPYATIDQATEAKPPFDGCLASSPHGRRWNDPRGQHSPAEIAFTPAGRRFFDERAVARDLALFVRSPKLAAARRSMKQGAKAPGASAITRGLPSRVLALTNSASPTAVGEIGVWSDGQQTISVSARSTAGKRLFVEIRAGRIARHNLEGLAFVF